MASHRFRVLPALAIVLALVACPAALRASSHSEAPGSAKDRLADDTDLYAWVSPDAPDRVTLVGNWVPLIEPGSGPNFYAFDDEATYWFNIDNVGDAQDHVRYAFTFKTTRQTGATFLYNTGVVTALNDPDLNVRQTYTVTRYDNNSITVLGTDLPVAPAFVGPKSMPNYGALAAAAVSTLSDGSKVFAGPRDDPFFVDLAAIFDLLTIRRLPGNRGGGLDGVGGYDVMTIAIQIPQTRLTSDGLAPAANNSVIGIYATTERPATRTLNADGTASTSGAAVQVSRLGNPLVNEVVIPLQDKDKFNASKPPGDGGSFLNYVLDPELAKLLTLLYGIPTPPAPRNDLVAVFLTGIDGLNKPANAGQVPCEMLRLNMAIPPASRPNRLGILRGDNAGFPNGRRLADDVVDIAERVVAGATPFTAAFDVNPNRQLGDGVDANDRPFLPTFPYVAPPHDPLAQPSAFSGDRDRDRDRDDDDDERDRDRRKRRHDDDRAIPVDGQGGRPATGLRIEGNPASANRLAFDVATASHVTLEIFDLQGRVVRTLVDQEAAPGSFVARWDGATDGGGRAARGVYFARLRAGDQRVEKKIVLE